MCLENATTDGDLLSLQDSFLEKRDCCEINVEDEAYNEDTNVVVPRFVNNVRD